MSIHRDIVPLGDMLDYGHRVMAKVTGISRIEHPEIDWPKIAGMRSRIVHDQRRIDLAIVWETATLDVPRRSQPSKRSCPPIRHSPHGSRGEAEKTSFPSASMRNSA